MIRINLIPREIYVAEVRRQLRIVGIGAGVFVLFVFLAFLGWRFQVKSQLDRSLTETKTELRKYQAIVDKVNALEKTRNQLRARRDVIKELLVGRVIYPKFFEDFMALLPAEVWISNMSTRLNESGVLSLNISANSVSNFAIADWLSNLQTSPLCRNVQLGAISSSGGNNNGPSQLSFSIQFDYQRKDTE